MSASMPELIAKVGKGEKGAKDLTYQEAAGAMRLLLEDRATPAQAGAFLLAMRIKGESVSELAAFTSTAREYVPPLPLASGVSHVDIPTYAGKQDSWHVLLPASIIAAAAGVPVLLHGYDGVPNRLSTASVASQLGIPTELDPQQSAQYLLRHGFAYLDVGVYHPLVFRFLELRKELGVRSFFQPVARMLNPGRAGMTVMGMSHPPYFEKMAEALRMMGMPRALVIRGLESEPEVSITSITKAIELRDDRIVPFSLQPKDFDMPFGRIEALNAPGLAAEADLIQQLLGGQMKGTSKEGWALINAAMILYAGGKAASIPEALPLARETLSSGAANLKLRQLVST